MNVHQEDLTDVNRYIENHRHLRLEFMKRTSSGTCGKSVARTRWNPACESWKSARERAGSP